MNVIHDNGYSASVAALHAGSRFGRDDEDEDEARRRRVIPDGGSIRVPMMLMDSVQRGLALHDAARVASDARMIADARAHADAVRKFAEQYAIKNAKRSLIDRYESNGYGASVAAHAAVYFSNPHD